MDRTGIIVKEMGNYSKVKLVRHTACGNCGACQLGDEQKDIMLVAKNSAGAKMGDLVEVTMATDSVLSAAFIMYVIPLAGLLIGLLIGQALFNGSDVYSALSGLVLMSLMFMMIKLNDKKFLNNYKYTAHILKVLQSEHEGMIPLN